MLQRVADTLASAKEPSEIRAAIACAAALKDSALAAPLCAVLDGGLASFDHGAAETERDHASQPATPAAGKRQRVALSCTDVDACAALVALRQLQLVDGPVTPLAAAARVRAVLAGAPPRAVVSQALVTLTSWALLLRARVPEHARLLVSYCGSRHPPFVRSVARKCLAALGRTQPRLVACECAAWAAADGTGWRRAQLEEHFL